MRRAGQGSRKASKQQQQLFSGSWLHLQSVWSSNSWSRLRKWWLMATFDPCLVTNLSLFPPPQVGWFPSTYVEECEEWKGPREGKKRKIKEEGQRWSKQTDLMTVTEWAFAPPSAPALLFRVKQTASLTSTVPCCLKPSRKPLGEERTIVRCRCRDAQSFLLDSVWLSDSTD